MTDMTIADVRVTPLRVPWVDPPHFAKTKVTAPRDILVVEIETKSGIVGIGYLHVLSPALRTIAMCLEEAIVPLVKGRDATAIEALADPLPKVLIEERQEWRTIQHIAFPAPTLILPTREDRRRHAQLGTVARQFRYEGPCLGQAWPADDVVVSQFSLRRRQKFIGTCNALIGGTAHEHDRAVSRGARRFARRAAQSQRPDAWTGPFDACGDDQLGASGKL